MNPNIGHEAGETARSLIGALKNQPGLLVLFFANLMLLIFLFVMAWMDYKAWEQVNDYRINVGKEILRYVTETSRLLAQCSSIPADQMPKPPEIK